MSVAFVLHGGDAVDLLVAHQLGDALLQHGFVHLVWQLGDDDLRAPVGGLLELDLCANQHTPAAGGVRMFDIVDDETFAVLFVAHHQAASGKVWALDELKQIVDSRIWMIDQMVHRIDHFAQVVRRHIGRHTDGNTGRAIAQQVRKTSGQHDRLVARSVVVGHHIDGVHVQVGQHLHRQWRETRLGVAHGGWWIAVDRAEIPLAIDERVAHVEWLRQPHQRRIDDRFAVRMVIARGISGDLGALAIAARGRQIQVVHRDQNAPLSWLQSVANIRQRPRRNDAHCVVEVRRTHLVLDEDLPNVTDVLCSH